MKSDNDEEVEENLFEHKILEVTLETTWIKNFRAIKNVQGSNKGANKIVEQAEHK